MKRLLLRLGPVAVSAVLLVLVLRRVRLDDSLAALARIRPGTLALAIALTFVAYAGRAQRWAGLLARAGLRVRARACYVLTLLGTGYGLVTPGRVGEFARVLHLDLPRARTLASVVWDRVTDVLLLEALGLPAFLLVPAWRGPLLWLFAAIVAATGAVVAVLESDALQRVAARGLPFTAGPIARWQEASRGTLTSSAFAVGLAGGLFFYVVSSLAAFLLAREIAPGAPPTLVFALPLIALLGNLPVAFSGLGLREQVSAVLFRGLGLGVATGPVFSLLWFTIVTLIPGLLGLLLAPTRLARVPAAAGGGPR